MVYSPTSNALWFLLYYMVATLSIIIIKIAIWWHLVLICLSLITREVVHFPQIYGLLVCLVLFMLLYLFYGSLLFMSTSHTHMHTPNHLSCWLQIFLAYVLLFNFLLYVLKSSYIFNILVWYFIFLSLALRDYYFWHVLFFWCTHLLDPQSKENGPGTELHQGRKPWMPNKRKTGKTRTSPAG